MSEKAQASFSGARKSRLLMKRADIGRTREWKAQVGRLTFYNAPREFVAPGPVESAPMTALTIHDAFVSRVIRIPTRRRPLALGAIYENRILLPDIVQNRGRRGVSQKIQSSIDPIRIASAAKLTGSYVYLEIFRSHFGHFLLETMSRAWYLTNLHPNVRIILHGDFQERDGEIPGYVRAVLNALSIEPGRIVLADHDLLVEELIVPSPQFWLGWKASPGFCHVFDHLREELAHRGYSDGPLPKKVYLSRRQFTRRLVGNEADAETLFASRGFHIVSPEKISFEQQVMLAGNASHLAGLAGSALHMILFNNQPGAKLIELSVPRRARGHHNVVFHYRHNQLIINEVRGVEAHHIFCTTAQDQNGLPTLDTSVIQRALDEIS